MTAAKGHFSNAAGVISMGDFNADCGYLNNQQKASLAIFNTPGRYHSLIPDTADTTTSINTDCAYDRVIVEGNSDVVADSAKVYRYDTSLGINAGVVVKLRHCLVIGPFRLWKHFETLQLQKTKKENDSTSDIYDPSCCSDPSVQAGFGYFAHQTYCELFYQCDSGLNRYEKACGPGTIYSASSNVCVKPEQAVCSVWESYSKNVGNKFPALCCDQFYEFGGSGYTLRNCSAGNVFKADVGQCLSGTCNDHPSCVKNAKYNGGTPYTCYDKPEANPCTYRTEFATINIPNRPCPAGTAFNQELCQCSTLTNACPSVAANYSANKLYDPQCQASFNLDFDNAALTVTSNKLNPGVATPLNYFVSSVGVSVSGGYGIFRSDPLSAQPYVYAYVFNSNQLASPLAISIVFKCEGTNTQTFSLLTNAYNYRECTPTLEVNVICTANRNYNAVVTATGATATSVNAESRISATYTGSSIGLNANGFVEFDLYFDGSVTAQLVDVGNTNNRLALTSNAGRIGAYLATNKCGFVFGRGLFGQMDKVTVREGCGDFSKAGRV
ncbi:hypothetical protein Btru_018332 [Bulinus truncatus]|nr:hypothetical protein Btru_018332 [Bulinus truncatus]